MNGPRTLESIARERFYMEGALEVAVRPFDAPYGTKPIHFITGYRPEDDDGGCMATGTNSMVYGYTMAEDGIKRQWLHTPDGLTADGWRWIWTRRKEKRGAVTSCLGEEFEPTERCGASCRPQPTPMPTEGSPIRKSAPPIGPTNNGLRIAREILDGSIDEHTIRKLEGDVLFWKGMFLIVGILGIIVGITK